MESATKTDQKLLWMNKNLKKAWKDENNKDYTWLLSAASTLGQFVIGKVSPALVPAGMLNTAAKAISGQAGELIPGGHGIFDKDDLHMSKAEKTKLKNEKALFKAVGESTFLFIWSAVGSAAPIVGGIVLITAGLTYILKRDKIASQKRWEEVTASMMAKYEAILEKVQAKKEARQLFYEGVEKVRIEEFRVQQEKNAIVIAEGTSAGRKVALTPGALVRLYIYLDYFLNLKVDQDEYTGQVLADVYALIYKDVEKRSDNTAKFDEDETHNADYKSKQEKKVLKVLSNVD